MEFESLTELQRRHPAWRLLCADSAPLVLGFLGEVFEGNARSVSASDLTARLEDVLFALNEDSAAGADRPAARFPRKPAEYLNSWAAPEAGWLRKYYPEGSDEPHYDGSPNPPPHAPASFTSPPTRTSSTRLCSTEPSDLRCAWSRSGSSSRTSSA